MENSHSWHKRGIYVPCDKGKSYYHKLAKISTNPGHSPSQVVLVYKATNFQ